MRIIKGSGKKTVKQHGKFEETNGEISKKSGVIYYYLYKQQNQQSCRDSLSDTP